MRGFGSVNGRSADGCGQNTGRLQAVCRKSAASLLRRSPRPSAPKAKSQKPKAESRKPKAESRKPRPAQPRRPGFCGLAGRFRGLPRNRPKAWFLLPQTRPKPASGRVHGPGSTAKTGAKKPPLKTPPSHGFRGFAAIKAGAKSRRFPGRGFAERAALLAGWRAGLGPAFHARHCLACCWARHRAA